MPWHQFVCYYANTRMHHYFTLRNKINLYLVYVYYSKISILITNISFTGQIFNMEVFTTLCNSDNILLNRDGKVALKCILNYTKLIKNKSKIL